MIDKSIKNIVICGEIYSDNYGDGVISHCLAYACKEIFGNIGIKHIDISLRKGFSKKTENLYSESTGNNKVNYFKLIKRIIGWMTIRKKMAFDRWLDEFKKADFIIVGGGQLFMDYKLGFPLKVYVISLVAKSAKSKVFCVACGFSSSISLFAKILFSNILFYKNMKNISVRDNNSKNNFIKYYPHLESKLTQTYDPAIFTKDAYGITDKVKGNIVGLNIMHASSLIKVVPECERFEKNTLKIFWIDLINYIVNNGYTVYLLTNGDVLDNCFLNDILNGIGKNNINSVLIPDNPEQLVKNISKCDVIVAHRLHANIISYALNIPSVGLIWDDKVSQFGKQTKRSEFFIDPINQSSENIYNTVCRAFNSEFDGSSLQLMQSEFLSSLEAQISDT